MKTYKRYQYEITNAVAEVWSLDLPNEDNKPSFRQSHNLIGQPFASDAEAEAYVKNLIDELTTPPEVETPEEPVE